MKAKELRIGNLVHLDLNIPSFQTHAILAQDIVDLSENRGEIKKIIYAIPLTEDWLVRFGFKRNKKICGFYDGFILKNVCHSILYLRPSYEGGYYWGFYTTESYIKYHNNKEHELYHVKPIEFVHTLQNLLFALSGEELTATL